MKHLVGILIPVIGCILGFALCLSAGIFDQKDKEREHEITMQEKNTETMLIQMLNEKGYTVSKDKAE